MFPDELLSDGERVEVRFRADFGELSAAISWSVVLGFIAFLYGMSDSDEGDGGRAVAIAAGVLIALLLAKRIVRWATTFYVVTDERILWRTGLTRRRTSEIALAKIDSIQVETGLLDRMRGTGHLVFRAANWSGDVHWKGVPGVAEVHATLSRLVKADREAQRPPAS
ncbi:PH domain-containing protein [Glycomyces paridis]|uniref:PH domain-containing protein n=1 Tax=Glycomyces paridis TaxID=2126555 RepID=A0A4S8PB71_9ACTN|nr:PH domain-containing protein [Glycomyces paridis]THV26981.1 PH domain-containing protein [Glycomyces paridis]